ncbi:MAG: SDR family oxidoreductase [Acidimicrobiia bacterium]|nr:SDR family oxidoreductase [Acidimicrobiia bacterium]
MGELQDRVAIVTGGGRGIGLAYARGLARVGASVVIADIGDMGDAVADIREAGGIVEAVKVDVSDPVSTEKMAAFTFDRFGRIDVLINNAAHFSAIDMGPFDEIEVEEWDKCFAVNVKGSWLAAKAVTPHMKDRSYGKIINISSMTVPDGVPGFAHYVSTKAAIVGLTRALARELGAWNIAVNTLTPDYIPHDAELDAKNPGIDEMLVAGRSFQRTQVPEDMVGAAIFLASSGSDFITGQNIYVNGGRWFG